MTLDPFDKNKGTTDLPLLHKKEAVKRFVVEKVRECCPSQGSLYKPE